MISYNFDCQGCTRDCAHCRTYDYWHPPDPRVNQAEQNKRALKAMITKKNVMRTRK